MEEKLLIRFLERKCEVEEARLVLQWIEQSEENKAAFVRLQSLWTAIEMDKATELNLTYPIGSLLFDIWYDKDHNATPIYMTNAVIKNSTLVCPDELNEKMLSTSHIRAKQEDSVNRILYDFNRKEELCSQN